MGPLARPGRTAAISGLHGRPCRRRAALAPQFGKARSSVDAGLRGVAGNGPATGASTVTPAPIRAYRTFLTEPRWRSPSASRKRSRFESGKQRVVIEFLTHSSSGPPVQDGRGTIVENQISPRPGRLLRLDRRPDVCSTPTEHQSYRVFISDAKFVTDVRLHLFRPLWYTVMLIAVHSLGCRRLQFRRGSSGCPMNDFVNVRYKLTMIHSLFTRTQSRRLCFTGSVQ
jgi:hypothetical protein